MTKPLLKQFGDLRPADFEAHPVWIHCHVIDYDEPWYDETDEETFRPRVGSLPADPHETILLVSASFQLRDGTRLKGFVTPVSEDDALGTPDDLGSLQPAVFLPVSGRIRQFWGGVREESEAERSQFYAALGKSLDNVFPIRFMAESGLTAGVAAGTIPGFCSLAHKGWFRKKRAVKVQR